MNYNNITINHIYYTAEKIKELKNSSSEHSDFLKKVYAFIVEWLDEKNYITVKTSGSTGKPKEIQLKKSSLIHSALQTQKFFNLNRSQKALLCLPVDYIAGKMMIIRAFVIGYDLLITSPSAKPFEHIQVPIDFAAVTPNQLYHIVDLLKYENIKTLIVGGSDIPQSLIQKIQSATTHIYATYGMTETCSHVALRKLNGPDTTEIYTALEHVNFQTDENNCLVIEAKGITDQKLYTHDLVELIDAKHFRWLGRYDNVINSGGIKIHPEILEQKLANVLPYPFFIGWKPDAILYQRIVLFIEKENLTQNERQNINQWVKQLLLPYEQPKEIIALPRFIYSENNKLLRHLTMKQAKH